MKRILIVTESLGIDGLERGISVLAPKWSDRMNGFLVPTGNLGAMSTAMFELVGNPGTAGQIGERTAELKDNLNVNNIAANGLN